MEVRNWIRREFEAMVRREQEMWQKAATQVRDAELYYSMLMMNNMNIVNLYV